MTDHPKADSEPAQRVTPEMLREFLAHLSKPDDDTVTVYADGRAIEVPVV
jgi:hypothetical protein